MSSDQRLSLKYLFRETFEARSKWMSLLTELEVDQGTISAICQKWQNNPDNCLREGLSEWLNGDNRSWKEIAEALSSVTVGHKNLADKIRKNYIYPRSNSALVTESELRDHDSKQVDTVDYSYPKKYEIFVSYVVTEASSYAVMLKKALEEKGFSVFLDAQCIQGGRDWQDTLNDAIINCALFVPIVTPQYGETRWTNREVKLADVLQKIIIPINFLTIWPPKSLAIQFATIQYMEGFCRRGAKSIDSIEPDMVCEVATDIALLYEQEKTSKVFMKDSRSVAASGWDRQASSDVLQPVTHRHITPHASSLRVNKRKSFIRSYASVLPSTVDKSYEQFITSPRLGENLVVICSVKQQQSLTEDVRDMLRFKGYEVWCTMDIDETESKKNSLMIFQQKADEAGVVLFLLSEEFAVCPSCQHQVYYCEQRKRFIPLIYRPMKLPPWIATLIGTNKFINCQAADYQSTILERVELLLDAERNKLEAEKENQEKTAVAKLCSKLKHQLPKGKQVYISGGTDFYSKNGRAICEAVGKKLAQDEDIVLITGGFYGVGDTVSKSFYDERLRMQKPHNVCHVVAERDDEDRSSQTRQNPDGTFHPVPHGDTLFFCMSVREREILTPSVVDLCILIEGGPGAAFEAQQFTWNGNRVIPVKSTEGAAGGLFNVPPTIFHKPPKVDAADWDVLSDQDASPAQVASAVFNIVQEITWLNKDEL